MNKLIKGLICLYVTIEFSNFIYRILENTPTINIIFSRFIGCIIAGVTGVLLYKYVYIKTLKLKK